MVELVIVVGCVRPVVLVYAVRVDVSDGGGKVVEGGRSVVNRSLQQRE